MSRMVPGETYADFAALRDEVGHNKRPKLKILEETVNKANDIDDATDNVAQGMLNIDPPWATAPCPYLVPVDGTTGHTLVIPGIGYFYGILLPRQYLVRKFARDTRSYTHTHRSIRRFASPNHSVRITEGSEGSRPASSRRDLRRRRGGRCRRCCGVESPHTLVLVGWSLQRPVYTEVNTQGYTDFHQKLSWNAE
ncbi:hypothetical protein PC113_g2276 [Phytophthora cactorum]|uniref:Uncharacterized protein n=1 Tax=Phytophthora cactorum TaxID=29920 RepID=A0A8T0ZUI7_9STRA|nr:hypothetical protein PC113_g2276 [Phytophthora cactorum]